MIHALYRRLHRLWAGDRGPARFLVCGILGVLLAGCGTLPNGRDWGEDATLAPGWNRIGRAAWTATSDPLTWGPAAGAAVFGLTDWDRRVSNWASDHTPVFGSQDAADNASDSLKTAAGVGVILTGLATPGGSDPLRWTAHKAKGLGVEVGTWLITSRLTGDIKGWTGRERPDGSDRESLPSLHSTKSFTHTALGRRNVDSLGLAPAPEFIMKSGFDGLAAATAWARIEAHKHYPSDVLAGAALGNFIALFLHDAFLGLDDEEAPRLAVEPARSGWVVRLDLRY